MKRFFAISVPVLAFFVLLTLLVIPTAAKEPEVGYAVYNSEADYLANPSRPAQVYNTNLLTSEAYATRGYILCYGDVSIVEETMLEVGQSMIIDLNGHTLTAQHKLKVNGNSSGSWNPIGSLTIKNGTVIHKTYQFIQPRCNSEIYFENCNIIETSPDKYNSFIYDGSCRIISFKDCTITVEKGARPQMITLGSAFSGTGADRLYKDEEGKQLDYVRNVVFENTVFIDNSEGFASIIYVQSSHEDYINISFTDCSSFNTIGDSFITYANDDTKDMTSVSLYISKSTRYKEKSIPFNATAFGFKLFDSIERVGHRVVIGNECTLLAPGEEQNPESPKLIFGDSGNTEYPYQLCFNTVSVTWFDGTNTEGYTVDGIAEGAVLSHEANTRGYYFNPLDNNRVYNDALVGWSTSEEGDDPSLKVTVPNESVSYYAVFENYPVSIVAFKDGNMLESDILGGIAEPVISSRDMSVFSDGAYVYFYTDVKFASDEAMTFANSCTLDLGGNTLYKNYVSEYGSARILIDGASVLIKNGEIVSSMTSVAEVISGELSFLEVDMSFDSAPAFYVLGGKVELESSALTQCTNDKSTPAFALSATAFADISIDNSAVSLRGPLAASLSSMVAPVSIYIGNSDTVEADSIYLLHESIADKYSGAEVKITLDTVDVKSNVVFDVATNSKGKPAMCGEYEIVGDCRFTSRPMAMGGVLRLPLGLDLVGIEGEGYTLLENPVKLKFGASVGTDLTMTFYVPTSVSLTYAETVLGRADKDTLLKELVEGTECYAVRLSGISAADCLNTQRVRVGFTLGDKSCFSELEYSLTEYFDELLLSDDPLVRKLAAAAMNYIFSAYSYSGSIVPSDFSSLMDSAAFSSALRDVSQVPSPVSKQDRGNIGVAFTGAQLYLSSCMSVRFNLRSDFTGTLNVCGTAYSVTDGKVGDTDYIEVKLSVLDLYREKIVIEGASLDTNIFGAYSLADYIASLGADDGALRDMLLALYAYCYEAYVYNNGGVLPPYIDHIPPVDVELK